MPLVEADRDCRPDDQVQQQQLDDHLAAIVDVDNSAAAVEHGVVKYRHECDREPEEQCHSQDLDQWLVIHFLSENCQTLFQATALCTAVSVWTTRR